MPAKVIIHRLNPGPPGSPREQRLVLYPLIERAITARGGDVVWSRTRAEMFKGKALPADGHLHVVENGFCSGEGWLSAALAYLTGFWHLNAVGILADSPAGAEVFDPAEAPRAPARAFARDLRRRFMEARVSRYTQKQAVTTDLPEGSIAVFLQGPQIYARGQSHLPVGDMLRAVVEGAGNRPVIVKSHPVKPEFGAAEVAALIAEGHALHHTDANVHDILAASAVSVSVNSAVALEGFLHRKPAILFGKSDFPSLVETVGAAPDFAPALTRALTRDWEYSKMLHWYFTRHTLQVDAPDAEAQVLAAFAGAGFGAERLGLKETPP